MVANLSREDFELLKDLNSRGGRATISGNWPRHGAERLVAAECATSRPLNISDVEYELTQSGRTMLVLGEFGLGRYEISTMTIEPHRFEVDGRWWVKISSPGNPALLMDIGSTTKLAAHLRAVGADELAGHFEAETERARRYSRGS